MPDIRFNCPECGDKLAVDEKGAGLRVPCPVCKATITIPKVVPPPLQTTSSGVPANGTQSGTNPLLSRIFQETTPKEADALLANLKDGDLVTAFQSLDMSAMPVSGFCTKYFRHPKGGDRRLSGLTYVLVSLTKSGRHTPATPLAAKLVSKFTAKQRHGVSAAPSGTTADEWHIGDQEAGFYLESAKELMKEGIDRHQWALSILDATATDWPTNDEVVFWRAAAAYNIWHDDKTNQTNATAARSRINDFLNNRQHRKMGEDAVSHMVKSLRELEAQTAPKHDGKAIRAEFKQMHDRLSEEKSRRLPAGGDIYMALGMVFEQAQMETSKTIMAKYRLTQDELQKILQSKD